MQNKPRILVADDEDRNLRLMEAMLIPLGYEVVLARDGLEALDRVREIPPDVILLDVMMPKMDGFEVASKLRANKQTRDIPIVMVTALGEVKHRVKALESGADDFLTKPVDETELLTRVKTLVEKSERIRQLIVPKKKPLVPIVSIIVAVVAAIAATVFIFTSEPVTDVVIVEKEVVREAEVTKEVVKKEIEYRDIVKEVTVEKPIKQSEFASLEELKKWLAEKSVTKSIFFFVTPDGTQASSNKYDCDDYALDLQRRALEDGYLMSASIIEKQGQLHMINLATIGNEVYYIEPQTNEVWFYTYRD
ncbi:PleD family two-component system response regulator [Chloroflexota bacterium]